MFAVLFLGHKVVMRIRFVSVRQMDLKRRKKRIDTLECTRVSSCPKLLGEDMDVDSIAAMIFL